MNFQGRGANVEGPPICSGCGVLADASRPSCATCNAPYASPPLRAIVQPSGGYWVAVRATFTCNACRFDVPLNHFPVGEGVVCTRCGLEQRYDGSEWHSLIDFAHAVGDLGAPGSEHRFPDPEVPLARPSPFAELGVRASFVGDDAHRASPGNPLCVACKGPRVVVGRRERSLDVACTRCNAKSTYETPVHVRAQRLAGVLADEHEAGRREAAMIEQGGVVVLQCPSCSAPLKGVKDADGVVTCGYCHVPCRISSHTHARAGHKGTPVKSWWLYFEEPSPMRRRLLNEARQEQGRDRKRRERDEQRARSQRGAAHAAQGPKGAARQAKNTGPSGIAPLIAVLVAAPIIGVAVWYGGHLRSNATKPADPTLPGDNVLQRYSFAMTQAETIALLGADAKPGAKIKLKPDGVFTEIELGGVGGPTYSLALSGGPKLDVPRVLARLAKLAPNRIVADATKQQELSLGRTLLRVDPRPTPLYKARINVMTWVKGEPGMKAADAFFAALRHAALDGPEPTPAQLQLLNGAPFADAARFDVTTPIEDAAKRFATAFATGECKSQTDIMTKKTELTCTSDVDSAIVTEARFAWPSAAKTRLQRVTFVRAKAPAPDPNDCLTTALGAGEKKVVDFASGRAVQSWALGKRGDRITVDDASIEIAARDGAKPDEPADWTTSYAKVTDALARCGRRAP